MIKHVLYVMLILFSYLQDTAIADTSLPSDTHKLVGEAVFEMVLPKPAKDSLTYENPLPLHLIPYAVRNDKYYSIGTAFAISPREFVTAAHVMNLGFESQFKDVCVRDKDGNVFEIDKINKYSEQRDFAVFSIKDKIVKEFFQLNTAPRINQKVFAVGNALGEGIVIRDGYYTSSTPEAEEGAWKWLRFSAAASPGNSGGPLLDIEGKVIGIVLQKSPNENLNIALPIAEVIDAKENIATAHKMLKYSMDNIRVAKLPTFNKEISLPKTYQELNREIIDGLNLISFNTVRELFRDNKNSIFPNGRGADILLHSSYHRVFPNLIMQNEDGNWYASYPKEIKEAELPNNGRLRYGYAGNTLFLYIQKPDDVALETFYSDSKLFMDLILKGLFLPKKISSEQLRITSMGKSIETSAFTDSYDRKWLIKVWDLEYSDEKVVTFSLPIPDGCITLMRVGQTGLVNAWYIPELKILANFIYLSYNSTLKKWREFLKMKNYLPAVFSGIDISFDYNETFRYASKRLSFSYTPEIMKISDNSLLMLSFDFFKEKDRVIWDVSAVSAGEDKNNGTYVAIGRKIKPAKELGDKFQNDWENTEAKKFPYNKISYPVDKISSIATILKQPGGNSNNILYTVAYGQDGKVEQVEMERKIDGFLRSLNVYEYGQGEHASQNKTRNTYHDNSEYYRAVWNVEDVSKMQPRTSDEFILRGMVYQDAGNTEQAISDYDKAIESNSECAQGYFNRAIANQDRGKSELALADYSKVLRINPRHAESYCNRGNVYRFLGNLTNAIADYDKAIEIKPQYVLAYSNRGMAYGSKGAFPLALNDFSKALELDRNNADAYNYRGFTYKAQGHLQQALADFNRTIEINPKYTLAYINRGNTYAQQKDRQKACSDWKKACEQGICVNYMNSIKNGFCN